MSSEERVGDPLDARPAAATVEASVAQHDPTVRRTRQRRRRRRLGNAGIVAAICALAAIAVASVAGLIGGDAGPESAGTSDVSIVVNGIPVAPIAGREEAAQTWADGRLFVWGGGIATWDAVTSPASNGFVHHFLDAGARYDPVTGAWTPLPASPLSPRMSALALWVGSEVVVLGGRNAHTTMPGAAAYAPRVNAWIRLPDPANCPLLGATVGNRIYAFGACTGHGPQTLRRLDFSRRSAAGWTTLPQPPLPDVQQLEVWQRSLLAVSTNGQLAWLPTDSGGWLSMPTIPDVPAATYAGLVVAGGDLYAIGRADTEDASTSVIWRFDQGRWGQVATAPDAPDDDGGPVSAAAVDGGFVYRSQSFGVCGYTFTTGTATCRTFDSPLP
ncbi:MAG: hypothetical protein WBV37_06255, partial [Nocardioidaceae bacterium]